MLFLIVRFRRSGVVEGSVILYLGCDQVRSSPDFRVVMSVNALEDLDQTIPGQVQRATLR